MPSPSATHAAHARFTEALSSLGFSQYEARCYVGLLGLEPQTGYAVSKTTGVPQPKVYEALRKLVSRGAARQLPGEPVRFAAVDPDTLLDDVQASFDERLDDARQSTPDLADVAHPPVQENVAGLTGRDDVLASAVTVLQAASRRVYLSASALEITALTDAITACTERGVDVVLLAFGRVALNIAGVRVFRHASTDGAVFRHHQARHVALVADSRDTVFGLAPDGRVWSGIHTSNAAIIAAVKGYIRHDIDMQQVFIDFGAELVAAYGPGLQGLESYRAEQPRASAKTRRTG
jgi:sugar-specific transcriptional regulator TrmB